VLLDRLAWRLWPQYARTRDLTPLVFLGTWYLAMYMTAVMFDMLLLTCILGAWLALESARRGNLSRGLATFGVMLGLGMLAKGPVVLLYTLPLAFAAPLWFGDVSPRHWSRWYAATAAAIVLGAAIPGIWLLVLVHSADAKYISHLLVDQTADRVTGTLAHGHDRPWWWYLPTLPVLLLPWVAWPALWRACPLLWRGPIDGGLRFVSIGIGTALLVLFVIGGKQVHYLIPVLALAALLLARALAAAQQVDGRLARLPLALFASPILLIPLYFFTHQPDEPVMHWLMTVPLWCPAALLAASMGVLAAQPRAAQDNVPTMFAISIVCAAACLSTGSQLSRDKLDLEPLGKYLGMQQELGHPLAIIGDYEGQFGFYGRLQQPIDQLEFDEVQTWASRNPDGFIITKPGRVSVIKEHADFRTRTFDGEWLVISSHVWREEVPPRHDPHGQAEGGPSLRGNAIERM
jgi:4-amino-4-deoxy-L-arabinose transferase-like glycosyltransferase